MILETKPVPQAIKISVPEKKLRERSCIDEKAGFFFYKRVFDVIVSILFIALVLSWLFPFIALLIWLDSGGPVLFLQERVGRGGKSFICFKFRTIQTGDDGSQRINLLGNFLRKSNIDEFPQFVNVLLGSMSVVGPRPHTHGDCRRFSGLVPRYKLRNFVKPGITGLAQIKGYHGPAISEERIVGRYQFDRIYVKNASLRLDISIIHQTIVQSLSNLFRLSRTSAVQLAD